MSSWLDLLTVRHEPRRPLLMMTADGWIDFEPGLGEWYSRSLRWYLGAHDREWVMA